MDPCSPDPCGPHSWSLPRVDSCSCSCQPGMLGNPPNCRPECRDSSECSQTAVCEEHRCRGPCAPDPCGAEAECSVVEEVARCRCRGGYQGDPTTGCSPIPGGSLASTNMASLGSTYTTPTELLAENPPCI